MIACRSTPGRAHPFRCPGPFHDLTPPGRPQIHHHKLPFAAVIAAGAVLLGLVARTPAQDKAKAPEQAPGQADPAEAAIRKLAADYATAFNAGDAKAVAAFWTDRGESTDAAGETIQGRDAIEKSLAEQFKSQPKVQVEVTLDSVRPLGRIAAVADESVKARTAAEAEPVVTRFTSLLVRGDGGWKLASVGE
ncbi:MAG TPA: nuclear transport factor 2 family protein [Fimbriiglobus sp.]|nr:nuclear transport factor 2 family protein [Fimbriiglobus sp.]